MITITVAVITINYNHADDTIKCVDSVLDSDYSDFKVLVVDNGSEENDYRKLNSYYTTNNKVHVIRFKENTGYVGGVNNGLKSAAEHSPDYFLIMNNDTIIDKEAIKELVRTAEKYRGEAIVSGKVYNMDEPDTLQYVGQYTKDEKRLIFPPYVKGEREKDTGQFDHEMELGMADDIYWLLPKKVFDKVGYYSTYYFLYGEQNDYALRAKKEGFKLVYTPKAKLWHHHHLTTGGSEQANKRIVFWREFATLVLFYWHMPLFIFIGVYIKHTVYLLLNLIKNVFDKSSRKNNVIPRIFANFYFMKWLFEKFENNGYTPYN